MFVDESDYFAIKFEFRFGFVGQFDVFALAVSVPN